MTILRYDPFVLENPQIDPAVETRKEMIVSVVESPLFLEQSRSVPQMLAALISLIVFTAGIALKFTGGKK